MVPYVDPYGNLLCDPFPLKRIYVEETEVKKGAEQRPTPAKGVGLVWKFRKNINEFI